MNLLRQSTSQIIRFGPFLDSTDGVTPETGLTIAQADMQLSKDGAAFAQKNAAGNATHDTDGWYSTTLNTTDTATNAILLLQINVAGALPVWHEFYVVPAASYDAITTNGLNNVAATDVVSAGAITTSSGAVSSVTTVATTTTNSDMRGTDSAATAANLATVDSNVDAILVDTGTTIPATIADLPTVSEFNARTLVAANYFDPATDAVANVTLCATTTTNTDMRGTDGANTTTPPTSAAITDAVWDELQSAHTTANTFGKFLDVEVSSVSGGGGLTQQNVRDAMKLTPTAGSPSSGSVDEHLDDILTDTGTTIPGQITALNDVAATDIVSSGAITTSSGSVSTVTTVATTTTNTDMRGTDSANTVVPDNTSIAAILVDTGTTLPALIDDLAIKKNTAFSNFEFLMVLTSDGRTPATGLTVTGQRSVDGGSFTSVGGTIAEVSNGIYQFDALAADTNGDVITWRFLSATADDTFVTFKTVA